MTRKRKHRQQGPQRQQVRLKGHCSDGRHSFRKAETATQADRCAISESPFSCCGFLLTVMRYANHNAYVGFKRIVHDAQHPGDDAPAVPHADTWFPSEASADLPTATSSLSVPVSNDEDAEEDEEDEVAITSAPTSLTCPLTRLPFTDPVTSVKCPHTFEKSAILDMIQASNVRLGGEKRRRGQAQGPDSGQRAVQCPVCEQMLTTQDLRPDPLLLRRIRRHIEREGEGDGDDEDERKDSVKATQVDSSSLMALDDLEKEEEG